MKVRIVSPSNALSALLSSLLSLAAPVSWSGELGSVSSSAQVSATATLTPRMESRQLWTNPLPARNFSPLWDNLEEHLRSTFNKEPRLPLVYQAVLIADPEWLGDLASRGLSLDERTEAGDTPLCAAVRLGQLEMVRTLLLLGADPNLRGSGNQAPIVLASLQRPHQMMEMLLESGAEPNTSFATPVDAVILEKIVFRDLKEHLSHDRGITPLMACASRGDVEGVVTLMKHGAKTSICTSRHHRYPLNFAATQNYLFLMRVLLGRPADAEPDLLVTVSLEKQRAWITKNGQMIESTQISTGRKGFGTPPGRYVITDKHRSHTSTLYHVKMPWFMRLNCSAIGLHAGYVTGRPASHGCIRLPAEKAKQFFTITKVGDEVEIVP